MTYFDVPSEHSALPNFSPKLSQDSMVESAVKAYKGWADLIIELDRHLRYISPDYEVFQVKEKFGGLRYYANYVPREGETVEQQMVGRQIFNRLIDETCARSLHHCYVCGAEGRRWIEETGWIYTACRDHLRNPGRDTYYDERK